MRAQLLAVAMFCGATGFAMAQGTPATPPSTGTGGMTTATTTTTTTKYTTVKPTDATWSRLSGTNVYNHNNDKLGEIEDVVIENGKTITAVVIGVGGFLGMGERYVAVDPSSVTLTHDNDKWRAVMDATKDSLQNAPKFDYKKRG
ncbi:MAG TPA: PRC-barrel domain-containing protein [Acetobacteraceae bacterium]